MKARPASPSLRTVLGGLVLAALTSSCASFEHTSLDHTRETQTSGTFRSEAWAFTVLQWDFPAESSQVARNNAFDAGLPNLRIEVQEQSPDWGWWNWVLDILSFRKTVLTGTWGYDGEDLRRELAGD